MEINDTTMLLIWFYQLYGFAPYKIQRNNAKQIVDFQLNRIHCVAGIVIIIAFSLSSNYALLFDFYSEYPLRMKTLTASIVFWLDVNFVCVASLINAIVAIISLKNIRHVNQLLNKIDEDLSIFGPKEILHTKSAQRRIYGFVGISFILLTIMLGIDFYAWLSMAQKASSNSASDQNSVTNSCYFIPFYLLYTSFVPLHAKCAVTIYRIGLRYRSLNNIISAYAEAVNRYGYFRTDYEQAQDVVRRFIKIYDSLGMVLKCVVDESGIIIIILLISGLFSQVVSVYVFIDFFCSQDNYVILLQFGWICFHFIRIVSLTEASHTIFVEAQRTTDSVCKLMQTKHKLFILNHFWNKLTSNEVAVVPCGICKIERRMLTSIGATIITYVVLIIQFHAYSQH